MEALKGLSLTVDPGTVFGFLGPNGAGKTTTMHVLLGFIEPASGSAHIFGEDVRHSIARRRIGYLPERAETYIFLTGRELLHMAGRLFGMGGAGLRHRVDELASNRWTSWTRRTGGSGRIREACFSESASRRRWSTTRTW